MVVFIPKHVAIPELKKNVVLFDGPVKISFKK